MTETINAILQAGFTVEMSRAWPGDSPNTVNRVQVRSMDLRDTPRENCKTFKGERLEDLLSLALHFVLQCNQNAAYQESLTETP